MKIILLIFSLQFIIGASLIFAIIMDGFFSSVI